MNQTDQSPPAVTAANRSGELAIEVTDLTVAYRDRPVLWDLDFSVPGLWVRRSMARKKVSSTKNRRARFHCLPRDLSERLRRWMMTTPETQLLFPQPDAKPLSNKVLNRWLRELADRAGVPRISSHGCRHGVGSGFAALGAGEALIAELLGHADMRSSSTYTHVRVETTQAIVEARWAKLNGGKK